MADSQLPSTSTSAPGTSSKNVWTEYTHQDGRKYYYNTITKQTVWQKPKELKSPKELALEASPWKEYSTPEGKKYYHNANTSKTVWIIPEEYKALLDEVEDEKKTKDPATMTGVSSTATTPVATQTQAATTPAVPVTSVTPTKSQSFVSSTSAVSTPSPLRHQAVAPGAQPTQPHLQQQQQPPSMHGRDHRGPEPFMPPQHHLSQRPPFPHQQGPRQPRFHQGFGSSDNNNIRARERTMHVNEIPDFATKEEAEEAFKNLLRETGVTSTWDWDQTMRAVVTNPMYRALKTATERKSAFQDYVAERRIQEKEEEKARLQKQKQDFLDLLAASDKVTHASRYTTISRLFADEPAFKAIEDDRLRFSIFDNYVGDLIRKEKEEARQRRKDGMAALASLLQSMDEITLMTRWTEARELFQARTEFKESEAIRILNKIDQLTVYEDHIKHLEREYDQKRARERILRKRAERKRREAFKEVLSEQRSKGHLNAKTCWMQIHPLIKDDPRYLDILGQPGSTAMELFWDVVEELDERLYQDRKMIQDVLRSVDYVVLPETDFDSFAAVVAKQEKAAHIPTEDLKLIFEQQLSKAVHYAKEEKRRQEKQARKRAESFRFILKSLDPPVTIESNWEEASLIKGKVESTPEYAALENDEQRKGVFDRFIEYLKERAAKDHNSEDEDGSILEDDDDYYSKRSGQDRKRSSVHSSSKHHDHHHHHHHHNSSGHHSSIDRHGKSSRDDHSSASASTSSKRPHQNGSRSKDSMRSGESGSEDESEHHAKKLKPAAEDKPLAAGGVEEGEVIETQG
ncbi:PRP40 pre-mRNA processing factor 40 [Haplosporangium sp. Z 767]|nr:PRP40 pre-mRNA processing factor 40 [Haplosporangium sp. Z 767]KAF9195528.1 PRP40 pre-mRNA processing factor 40 [Haplosporangium sp. Z 11]